MASRCAVAMSLICLPGLGLALTSSPAPAALGDAGGGLPDQRQTASDAHASGAHAAGAHGSLRYRIEQLPGGTIASFDGWRTVPVMADGNMFVIDMCPGD